MPYTYTQPTVKPDFATQDLNNGAGGAANVQEPSTGKKQSGWDYGEKPQREFFNWIHRVTNNWIYYLDERVTSLLVISSNTQDAHTFFRNQS